MHNSTPPRVLLLTALLIGCADAGSYPAPVVWTDSAGVRIALNPGGDRPLGWQMEAQHRLGGEEAGPLSFYRIRPGLVAADAGGRIFVLDAGNQRVLAMNAKGRVHWEAGTHGGGPGEMESPNSLLLVGDSVVAVHDTRKLALVRFAAADGAVLEQEPFPATLFRAWLPHVYAVPGGYVLLSREPFANSDERRLRLLRVTGADTVQHFTRTVLLSSTARYEACGMTLTLPVPFAPQVRWAVHEGSVAAVTSARYVIDIFDGDGGVRSVRRQIEPEPVTRADVLASLDQAGPGGPLAPCSTTPRERLERHGFARERQVVHGLIYDLAGRLWVQRDGATGPIDVFDAAGGYLGTLPAGTPLPVIFLPDDRVGYVESDDFDVHRLVIARLLVR